MSMIAIANVSMYLWRMDSAMCIVVCFWAQEEHDHGFNFDQT